jgi:hypothetical protein
METWKWNNFFSLTTKSETQSGSSNTPIEKKFDPMLYNIIKILKQHHQSGEDMEYPLIT